MTLADLGATVIKIELPGRGDDARGYPPMIPDSPDSGYFWRVNRGKRSVTLDLREREGAAIFVELARHADVVVENFAPGTMDRFGVDYARLAAANPAIIVCSISGFGQSGPMAAEPAYDIVAQALSGMMSITGSLGGEPIRCGVSIGDLSAALYGVIAIQAALRVRERSGAGQHLDIAMLDCQVALLEDALSRYSLSGRVPGPLGTRHPSITPFQQFGAADGYLVVGVGNERLWERLCGAIGMAELERDPRFASNNLRTEHHAELEPILARRFAGAPREHWLGRLRAAGVPCAPVANLAEVARNPQLRERNMLLAADHPTCSELLVPGSPLRSVGSSAVPPTRSPRLGEHTEEVLGGLLGFDSERLAELRRRSII